MNLLASALQHMCLFNMRCRPSRLAASQQGFSLIELMIVVVIIGVISSIAIPAYTSYIKRGNAAEATSNLADLRIKMEQHYQDNRTYVGGACTPSNAGTYFTYQCTIGPTATTYTLRADGINAQGMSAFYFTVDQANAKTSNFDGTVGATCWLTKKDGTC